MKRTLKRGSKDLKPLRRKLWGLAVEFYVLRLWCLRGSLPARMVQLSKDLYFLEAGWDSVSSDVCFLRVAFLALPGPRGFCDPVEMASIDPSWNTDQGVKHLSEFASVKLISVMKVSSRCQGFTRQHQPSMIFCERYELELNCLDPKDGELCMSSVKSEETLMEARSDTDVQIVRETCV